MSGLTVKTKVHFASARRGKKEIRVGAASEPAAVPEGTVPRISRLMALAVRFASLIDEGQVKDYADLARLGHVTRARATQIMNLLNLAPDIQEDLLFLPRTTSGHDAIREWQIRPIAAEPEWEWQRGMWAALHAEFAD